MDSPEIVELFNCFFSMEKKGEKGAVRYLLSAYPDNYIINDKNLYCDYLVNVICNDEKNMPLASKIFVKEYNSPSEAVKELGIKSSSAITTSIRTGRCCANYQWSLEKVPFMKEITPTKSKKVKIAQYSLSGEFIKEFDTIVQVKKEFGSGVQKAIDGKISNYKGFVFKRLS
jgi:hypothetical protein